jgi:proteic killer suppression protein
LQTHIGHEILEIMNVTFEDKALEELFLTGKTTARKYCRLPMNVVKRYVKVVNYIKAASRIEDLFTVGSLHYEKKSGTLKGVDAVWITAQYRLLFHSTPNEDGIIVNALLEEISKHYE